MNLLIISGRLGQDATRQSTAGGTAVLSFSVAVDSGYGDNKKTNWFRCALFGKRAEGKLVEYLKKGTQVLIHGEVSLNEYQHEGQNKANLNVFVNNLELIGGKQSDTGIPVSKPQTDNTSAGDGFTDDIPFSPLNSKVI